MNSVTTPNIFIVEDNRFYGEIIRKELSENNYTQIELHTTGEDCIANLYKMPDIVLLDYSLEGSMNGVEVLKKIKAFNPNIQVIMLSAQQTLSVAIDSLKYGAFDYVIKNDTTFRQINSLLKKIKKWNEVIAQNKARKRKKLLATVGVSLVALLLLVLQSFSY